MGMANLLPSDLSDHEEKMIVYHANWFFQRFGIASGFEIEWFVNEAYLGVLDARKRVDKSRRGWRSFFSRRVRGAIQDALREYDEVPRSMRIRGEFPLKVQMSDLRSEKDNGDPYNNGFANSEPCVECGEDASDRKNFWKALSMKLSHRDAVTLRLYYIEGMSMKQIGFALGLTESRVSQMHRRVLRELRHNRLVKSYSNAMKGGK